MLVVDVTRAGVEPRRVERVGALEADLLLRREDELEAGMRQVRHKAKYRRDLNHLLRQLRLWPVDLKTARIYGDVYMELRRSGRVLSQVDIMVAALARQMKLTILTTDSDFEALPDIRTADWSRP